MSPDLARLFLGVRVRHPSDGVRPRVQMRGELAFRTMPAPVQLALQPEADFVLWITHGVIFAKLANFPIAKIANSA